jgi:hypothetical protein
LLARNAGNVAGVLKRPGSGGIAPDGDLVQVSQDDRAAGLSAGNLGGDAHRDAQQPEGRSRSGRGASAMPASSFISMY